MRGSDLSFRSSLTSAFDLFVIGKYQKCAIVFVFASLCLVLGCNQDALKSVGEPIKTLRESNDAELEEFLEQLYGAAVAEPGSAVMRARLAMGYDANGYMKEAIKTYEQAFVLDPTDARWPYLQALGEAKLGDIESAIETMSIALQVDSTYLPGILAQGFWLLDVGLYESACELFQSIEKLPHREDVAVAKLTGEALCRGELGHSSELAQINEQLEPYRSHSYVQFVLDRFQRDAGTMRDPSGIETVEAPNPLIWSDPTAGQVVEYTRGLSNESLLAEKLIESGRVEDAVALAESLHERYPHSVQAIQLLNAAYIALGKEREAIELLTLATREFPQDHTLLFNLGLRLEEAGLLDEAVRYYRTTLELRPEFLQAYDSLSRIFEISKQTRASIEILEESLQHRSADASTYYRIGVSYATLGDWVSASKNLATAVELVPEDAEANARLALTLGMLGKRDEAYDAINRARALDPDNPKVLQSVELLIENRVLVVDTSTQ